MASMDLTGQNSKSMMVSSRLNGFPRILTADQVLDDSDDDSVWCGPPSEPEDTGRAEIRALEELGLAEESKHGMRPWKIARSGAWVDGTAGATRDGNTICFVAAAAVAASTFDGKTGAALALVGGTQAPPKECPSQERKEPRKNISDYRPNGQPREPQLRLALNLIQPLGPVRSDYQKFVCVFPIGPEDDEEFCLVKRILGKNGNNMRRIAEECCAKVRLRGIGSGFLEGKDGMEANMPLQLNVSCSDFISYQGAVDRVATLLANLYGHYKKYAKKRGMEPPNINVNVEELRRDDHAYDLLLQKAQRSSSQRERDRQARQKKLRECTRERERARVDNELYSPPRRHLARERLPDGNDEGYGKLKSSYLLPGGEPIPATAVGRRLVARSGGAEHAAIVSAAARELQKLEREQREQQKKCRKGNKQDNASRKDTVDAACTWEDLCNGVGWNDFVERAEKMNGQNGRLHVNQVLSSVDFAPLPSDDEESDACLLFS